MQLLYQFIYTSAYPITLVILLLIAMFLSPWSRVRMLLRCIYIALMVLCVPYGFLVWLASIVADLYDDPIHKLNLFLILLFNVLTLSVLFSYLRPFKTVHFNSKAWLYSPFFVLFISLGCTIYLVLTK